MSRLSIDPAGGNVALCGPGRMWRRRNIAYGGLLLVAAGLAGCAVAQPSIPQPRPIVIHSGARIRADYDSMTLVNEWVTREQRDIVENPNFWVIDQPQTDEVYPWEGLRFGKDTVWVGTDIRSPDSRLVQELYGHMHLMVRLGEQEKWLPEAPDAVGYELERAILNRAADAWILGRTVFDTAPYGPLDELAYAKDAGFLDAFIFTARPDEFVSSRIEWARSNPGEGDRYRDWFLDTFSREPPGLRSR